MEKIDCRLLTKRDLANELNKILSNYMQVYDEYYSTGSRDSAFLKDLVDGIQGISTVLEVYVENDGYINSDYVLKLSANFTDNFKRKIHKQIRET